MILRHIHRHQRGLSLGANMTPLIDVTFLLLTFFMLASHFASAEKVEFSLPRPLTIARRWTASSAIAS